MLPPVRRGAAHPLGGVGAGAPSCQPPFSDDSMPDDVYTQAEVAAHGGRASCWVALHGEVYDFTRFLDEHPGGARGILRHAGTDASDIFAELHSQSIFAAFGPEYRIGRLAGSAAAARSWQGVPPTNRMADGVSGGAGVAGTSAAAVLPAATVLPSPFPHDAYTGSGLETFRFFWSVADKLLRTDDGGEEQGGGGDGGATEATVSSRGESVPPATSAQRQAIHRQKSNLGVLDHDRDWLHVGAAPVYAAELTLKRELLTKHAHGPYTLESCAVARLAADSPASAQRCT